MVQTNFSEMMCTNKLLRIRPRTCKVKRFNFYFILSVKMWVKAELKG